MAKQTEESKNISKAIETIIGDIDKNLYFDSHYVINELIRGYSDEYFNFMKSIRIDRKIAGTVHCQISLIVGRMESVEKVGNSLSMTIHGKADECACWKKI